MKFGLLYEHQLPRPWSENAERRLLKEALEQVDLADGSVLTTCGKTKVTF